MVNKMCPLSVEYNDCTEQDHEYLMAFDGVNIEFALH